MAGAEPQPERPAPLLLAERWVKGAGKPVQWGSFKAGSPESSMQAMLVVQQGPVAVFIRSSLESVVVFVVADLPMSFRQGISALPSDLRSKMLLHLKQELLSIPRCAFALHPPTLTKIEQLERFVVEQTLVLDEKEPSTRNRLLDAIMEVTVGALRAGTVLNAAGQPLQSGAGGRIVPDGMFR